MAVGKEPKPSSSLTAAAWADGRAPFTNLEKKIAIIVNRIRATCKCAGPFILTILYLLYFIVSVDSDGSENETEHKIVVCLWGRLDVFPCLLYAS